MELKEQEYILALAKYENITKAAEQLYVSQPTLSIFLKNLEERIGGKLFQYIDKKMVPTLLGEIYIKKAKELMVIQNEFYKEASDLIAGYTGRIKLGLHLRKTLYFIPKLICEFGKLYPNVEIVITEDSTANLEKMLLEGELDFIIVNEITSNSNVEMIPIYHDKLLIGISPNKLKNQEREKRRKNSKINLELIKNERFILQKPNQNVRKFTDVLLTQLKIKPKKIFEIQNIDTACQLAAEEYGVCFTMQSYSRFFNYKKPLNFYEIEGGNIESNVYIIYRKNFHLLNYMKDFLELVKKCF